MWAGVQKSTCQARTPWVIVSGKIKSILKNLVKFLQPSLFGDLLVIPPSSAQIRDTTVFPSGKYQDTTIKCNLAPGPSKQATPCVQLPSRLSCGLLKISSKRDITGGAVVKTPQFQGMGGRGVPFLVGKLRSHVAAWAKKLKQTLVAWPDHTPLLWRC